MKLHLYAIRDSKTGYFAPSAEVNDFVAVRNFEHAVTNGDSLLFSHSDDFDLFKIGEYDSDSGIVAPCVPHVHLMSGRSALMAKGSVVDA